MAVHHFVAADLVVSGWQPIETFPQDGRVYEICENEGPVSKAMWAKGALHIDANGTQNPTHWKIMEE